MQSEGRLFMEEIGLKTLGRYIYNHVMSDRETYIYNFITTFLAIALSHLFVFLIDS